MRAPVLQGMPIELRFVRQLRDRRGEVHGGAFLRERRIAFDAELRRQPRELARIFVHELFHFAWVRLGNPRRRSWEELLAVEFARAARGELGWSAEWRKRELDARDRIARTLRWREYCCESFCDTAAWLFAEYDHPEFTLAPRHREDRKCWFVHSGVTERISI
ncbi:MAG TPA: hypothetical protein VN442_14335 [Bryobacteraceae bacterium]|nr:hypothetical protein [Bryobacteraceae bacterium]